MNDPYREPALPRRPSPPAPSRLFAIGEVLVFGGQALLALASAAIVLLLVFAAIRSGVLFAVVVLDLIVVGVLAAVSLVLVVVGTIAWVVVWAWERWGRR